MIQTLDRSGSPAFRIGTAKMLLCCSFKATPKRTPLKAFWILQPWTNILGATQSAAETSGDMSVPLLKKLAQRKLKHLAATHRSVDPPRSLAALGAGRLLEALRRGSAWRKLRLWDPPASSPTSNKKRHPCNSLALANLLCCPFATWYLSKT